MLEGEVIELVPFGFGAVEIIICGDANYLIHCEAPLRRVSNSWETYCDPTHRG
jgi:hypothetical protein